MEEVSPCLGGQVLPLCTCGFPPSRYLALLRSPLPSALPVRQQLGVLGTDGAAALKPLCMPHAPNVITHSYSHMCAHTHTCKQIGSHTVTLLRDSMRVITYKHVHVMTQSTTCYYTDIIVYMRAPTCACTRNHNNHTAQHMQLHTCTPYMCVHTICIYTDCTRIYTHNAHNRTHTHSGFHLLASSVMV